MSIASTTSSQHGTISIPFIYLKARGRSSIPTKKARLPSNLKTLLKICNRIFTNCGVIKTLYNTDGSVVNNIGEICPGSTIIVSNRDPNEAEADETPVTNGLFSLGKPPTPSAKDANEQTAVNSSYNNNKGTIANNDSYNALFCPQVKPINSNDINDINDYSNSNVSSNKLSSEVSQKSRSSRRSQIQSDLANPQSQLSNQRDQMSNSPNSVLSNRNESESSIKAKSDRSRQSQKQQQQLQQQQQQLLEERFSSESSTIRRQQQHQQLSQSPQPDRRFDDDNDADSSSELEIGQSEFVDLFNSIIGSEDLSNNVSKSLSNSESWINNLLSRSTTINDEQLLRWYKGLHSSFAQLSIPVPDESLYGKDAISRYLREVISRHRFSYAGGYSDHKLRVAILGPRGSGKSHLLSCFADEMLLELAAIGNWKQFFIFPMNFQLLAPFYREFNEFYINFIDMILNALLWQAPIYTNHIPAIRKLFLSVLTLKSPPTISQSSKFYINSPLFATSLQKIAQHVYELWTDPEAMPQFMTTVYLLPSLISQSAGFGKVIFFIDNIEFADVELIPSAPFSLSESVRSNVYNIEFLQFALSNQYYVIAGQEQKRVFESFSPIEAGFDLEKGIDIISTIGIIPNDDNDNRLVKMEVQGEPVPFALTFDVCCGVPAYVALWVELNDSFDELEEMEEGEEKDEEAMVLVSQAQHVVDEMFLLSDNSPMFVTAVKRSAKECEGAQ